MTAEEIIAYCKSKKHAYIDYPFGDVPVCIKLNKKVFAQVYPKKEDYKVTLKCEPMRASFYRETYKGKVVRGYHCPPVQQPFWNTMYIEDMEDDVLKEMMDHAYEVVLGSFPKKVQAQLRLEEEESK